MAQYRTQINFHMDHETNRKFEAVVSHLGISKTAFMRNAILSAYEQITDTIRVPVVGTISDCKVIIGNDTKYE